MFQDGSCVSTCRPPRRRHSRASHGTRSIQLLARLLTSASTLDAVAGDAMRRGELPDDVLQRRVIIYVRAIDRVSGVVA